MPNPYGTAPGSPNPGPYGAGPGYGAPWGWPSEVRHRPGPGAVVAATGLLLFLMSLFGLPWVSANGNDANFPDIRKAWENADAIQATPVAYTESPTAPAPPSDTDYDYLELYVEWGWVVALVLVASAVLVATILVPTLVVIGSIIGTRTERVAAGYPAYR
jgi:hypothetical protein